MKRVFSGLMIVMLCIGVFVLTVRVQPVRAATLVVPDNYPTIQGALDAASDGDTILVRNGTYNEDLSVDRNVTVIANAFLIGSITISETLDLENSTLLFSQNDPQGRPPLIAINGQLYCSNSFIGANCSYLVAGAGKLIMVDSVMEHAYLGWPNGGGSIAAVEMTNSSAFTIGDYSDLELNSSKVSWIYDDSGQSAESIIDSQVGYVAAGPMSCTIEESNISELALFANGDVNVTDFSPGYIENWNSMNNTNIFPSGSLNCNLTIKDSSIEGFDVYTGGNMNICNSTLYNVDLEMGQSGSICNSTINEMQIWLLEEDNVTLIGLVPGFYDSWTSLDNQQINAAPDGIYTNVSLSQTEVDRWDICGEGVDSGSTCDLSIVDCNLGELMWEQVGPVSILNSTIACEGALERVECCIGGLAGNNYNATLENSSIGTLRAWDCASICVSDCSLQSLIAKDGAVVYLCNCTVDEANTYNTATVFVVDSPHTVKSMLVYDSTHVQIVDSKLENLEGLGSEEVKGILQNGDEYIRSSLGTPVFNLVGSSNATVSFTFQILNKTGFPLRGTTLRLEKGDGTWLQNIATNQTGYATFDVTWGCATNTTVNDYFAVTSVYRNQPDSLFLNSSRFQIMSLSSQPIPGDINGDFKVSLADLVLLAIAYGSHPSSTRWNPNADIDGNGVVGLSDLVLLAIHYGQHYP